jgi:hypothetical protein
MLEKFATCAPVTRLLTVQEMCRLPIGCEYSRRICNKRLFSKQLPINDIMILFGSRMCRAVNRVRGRCVCKASSCRRRAKFSRTRCTGAKRADDPPEEMPERHNHGKNIIGTIRIQFCAKSFILKMYDVLTRDNTDLMAQSQVFQLEVNS